MRKLGKAFAALLLAVLMLAMTGCGFHIGTSSKKESHKDLFPDKTYSGAYKTSNVGYEFTLGEEYGKMMVYVDTSEGHKFEVTQQPLGFKVVDKDGNDVLQAICMNEAGYAEYTASIEKTKTINGRKFFYQKNDDGSADCFTYVADCGLNCGLVLEVPDGDTDNFRLVAFRGEPLDGASSDLYYYQGTAASDAGNGGAVADIGDVPESDVPVSEVPVSEVPESEVPVSEVPESNVPEAGAGVDTSVAMTGVSEEVAAALASLVTDYGKVNWGVTYSLFEDAPGVVVSIAPCQYYGDNALAVAITNLYSNDISFSASAEALDSAGNVIADSFIYYGCIGGGNTVIEIIDCFEGGVPDGRIYWSEMNVTTAYSTYVPWEADYSGYDHSDEGYISIEYDLYTVSGEACHGDMVTVLLLDETGNIVGIGYEYASDVPEGGFYSGSITIFGESEVLKRTKGVAMFATTTK